MVIVLLKGGLGNQLFQYAMGRRIAVDNNLPLKLDVEAGFKNDFYKRSYGLKHFNILEDFATQKEVKRARRIQSRGIIGKLIRLANRFRPYYKRYVINERNYHEYDINILRQYTEVYFNGYWQTEKYFKSIEEIIRKEFTVKYPLEGLNLKISNEIVKTNSVSLHIRRNHGISTNGKVDSFAVKQHGTIPIDYYCSAVKYLSSKYNNLDFFVFTDNPEWTNNNLKLSYPHTLVMHNNKNNKDYEELRLMSLCKHQIIANSTFSWWAAWLNSNPDKIVIAPKNWFANADFDTSDLIPKEWIKI